MRACVRACVCACVWCAYICVCVRYELGDLASSELLEEFCREAPQHNPGQCGVCVCHVYRGPERDTVCGGCYCSS